MNTRVDLFWQFILSKVSSYQNEYLVVYNMLLELKPTASGKQRYTSDRNPNTIKSKQQIKELRKV